MKDELVTAKPRLRRVLRERRNALGTSARDVASQPIGKRIFSLLREKNRLHDQRIAAYLANEREPDLTELIHDLQTRLREVLAPHFQDEAKPFYTLAPAGENLGTVQFKNASVREPREYSGGLARSPEELDVILIPGLAFDLNGNRLGQGGGWYDRVLARAPHALKIGVCFDCQILESVPHEAHDVKMDFVVTEKRLLEF
jgi:5-formyltetrahydrofolate cyclo-ligase